MASADPGRTEEKRELSDKSTPSETTEKKAESKTSSKLASNQESIQTETSQLELSETGTPQKAEKSPEPKEETAKKAEKAEEPLAEEDIDEGEAEAKDLRGCGHLFFSEGAYNRAFRPRWAHGPQHFFAILSFLMSFFQLFTFPVLLSVHDPVAFLISYFVWQLVAGIPLLAYEIMIGQFSAISYTAAIRRMVPVLDGFGWTAIIIGFVCLVKYVPILGWAFFYLVVALISPTNWHHPWLNCPPHAPYCYNLQQARLCEQRNASHIYFKGVCHSDTKHITDGDSALLNNIEQCVRDYNNTYFRLMALHWFYDMAQQKDPNCGVQFQFDACVLAKTPWLRDSSLNYAKSPFLQFYAPCGAEGWQHVGWYLYRNMGEKSLRKHDVLRLILLPFYHNEVLLPTACENLAEFLDGNHLTLSELIRQYCEAAEQPFWPCFRSILIRREIRPSQIYFENMLAKKGIEDNVRGNTRTLKETRIYPQPWLLAASVFVWVLIAVPTLRGPQWIGYTVLFTSFIPITTNLAVAYFGIQLPGFMDGVRNIFSRADLCALKDYPIWVSSFRATTSGMGLGSGALPVLASYGDFHQDTLAHVFILVFLFNLFTLLCSFNTLGLMGALAEELKMTVEELRDINAPAYTFYLYPDIDQVLGLGSSLALCLFFSMVVMGLGTASGLLETIVCHVTEHASYLTKHRIFSRYLLTILVCLVSFGLGVPFHSRSGMKWFDLMTNATMFSLSIVCCFSLLFIAIFYGPRQMSKDFGVMFGVRESPESVKEALPRFSRWFWKSRSRFYFLGSWVVIGPLMICFVVFAFVFIHSETHEESRTRYPFMAFVETLAKDAVSTYIPVSLFLVCFLYKMVSMWCRRRKFCAPFRPNSLWGPAFFVNRHGLELGDHSASAPPSNRSYNLPRLDTNTTLRDTLNLHDPSVNTSSTQDD